MISPAFSFIISKSTLFLQPVKILLLKNKNMILSNKPLKHVPTHSSKSKKNFKNTNQIQKKFPTKTHTLNSVVMNQDHPDWIQI